ncbi:LytR/AlgR family response regulator transcription factor [Clostridium felsineum]|uniref:Stage 0 sporulation protein A homolog n=1 Tax=Clostridium felsineum TaxID=36839 RepID=A0A1S8L495_9CLOT|nr:LytTR family DNA-binding domain-containing protein [Clostridium felsineum]MCR3758935.1 LytTR family DNA-binding domain-containing protein [Clostridium felsineum]URZ02705.1 Accessory gene regulator protein A [Clostridium felsineum]URZ08973.1 Accessory gene regulator protein A [Clostridium felsineum]URZ09601.1 Accessory gene regulator protein A [Clostridium felsineum]URZ14057.1 Accessory gene regulator protein A [Clostridium felsineum DSM 794]
MLEVFICEDNLEQRKELEKIVEDFILIENLDMNVSLSTENPYDIINYITKNSVSGLYFLDVDLKASINGIQLAAEIRKYDPRGFIVFVTTHAEMSYLTFLYKVEAMDYIIKDSSKTVADRACQCILDAQRKYSAKITELQKNFTIKTEDRIINIEFNKILFFETSFKIHKVILHSINRQIEFYAKMKDIEAKLDDSFYRCHKSYIVNKKNIKEININKRRIYMINGEECLISTRMLKGLIK